MNMAVQQFHRLTEMEIRSDWDSGVSSGASYLLNIIRVSRAIEWGYRIDSVKDFCDRWHIPERTFYRSKAKLISSGLLEEQILGSVTLRISTPDAQRLHATSGSSPATNVSDSATNVKTAATSGSSPATNVSDSATNVKTRGVKATDARDFEDSPDLLQIIHKSSTDLSQRSNFSECAQKGEVQDFIEAEIIDSQSVKEQSQLNSAESQIVEVESSAAASKPISDDAFLDCFYRTYNENKPIAWGRVRTGNKTRDRLARGLLADCGKDKGETLQVLVAALNFCAQDQWYAGRSLNVENFLAKDKAIGLAERWEVLQSNPAMPRTLEILADPKQAKLKRDLSIGMDKVREIEARELAKRAAANGDEF